MGTCALRIVLAVAISLLLELFLFNWHYFESLTYPDARFDVTSTNVQIDGNTATVTLDASHPSVELPLEMADLKSIGVTSMDGQAFDVTLSLQDEGNALLYEVAELSSEESSFVRVHPAGLATGISLHLVDSSQACQMHVELNPVIPLDLSLLRMACLVAFCGFVLLALSGSPLSSARYDSRRFLIALGVTSVVAMVALTLLPCDFSVNEKPHPNQYFQLAKAFCSGHLYVDVPVSGNLASLANPYDTSLREASNVDAAWDYAYWNGRYYVYFGALPALLYHLPFYLLTGTELPNWAGCAISVAICSIAALLFLREVCRRWFKNASQRDFLFTYVMLLAGCWLVYCMRRAGMYTLPVSTGLALLLSGWTLWLRAVRSPRIALSFALAGSTCIALTAACRPQLLAGGVFGVVIALSTLNGTTPENRAHSIKTLVASLLPFVFVGMALGAYNFARFGSFFDFGANYNLTTNDMTHRGFELDRIPLAAFAYLIQPPFVSLAEPHLLETSLDSMYYGVTISEPMYGGMLALSPWLVVGGAGAFCSTLSRSCRILSAASLAIVVIVVVFDANGAGILMRYFCDFGLLLAVPAALGTLALLTSAPAHNAEHTAQDGEKLAHALLLATGAGTLAMQLLWYSQGL